MMRHPAAEFKRALECGDLSPLWFRLVAFKGAAKAATGRRTPKARLSNRGNRSVKVGRRLGKRLLRLVLNDPSQRAQRLIN